MIFSRGSTNTFKPLGFYSDRLSCGKLQDAAREFLALLKVWKMAGSLDQLEPRAWNCGSKGPSVRLAEDAVVPSPQEQRRNADAMQAMLELRIVHVGRPRQARGCFAIARRDNDVGVGHGGVVALGDFRVAIGKRVVLRLGDGE